MKKLIYSTLAAAVVTGTLSAATTYSGPVFDLFAGEGNWSNGTPGAGNDGTISIDYSFTTLGAADNGNVNPLPSGTYSVTQTAGAGTGGQWNLVGNSNFTYNLNGGSLTSTTGTFFVNGHTLNIGGGDLTTQNQARIRGNLNISSGSFTTPNLDLEENTALTQTGGVITTSSTIALNQSNAGGKSADFLGGTFANSSATFLITNANVTVGIGGDFVFDATAATGLFNNTGGTSSIDFASDWTGSLNLDSAAAWDTLFEAEPGRVTVDGVNVTTFEDYFQNNGGVITFIPEPSTALLGLLACTGFLARRRQHS